LPASSSSTSSSHSSAMHGAGTGGLPHRPTAYPAHFW
jgi:hypothetical protein